MDLAFRQFSNHQSASTIPEIRCRTKVTAATCRLTWAIERYKLLHAKRNGILRSVPFSATYDTCNWILELHGEDGAKHPTKLCLKAKSVDEITKNGPIFGIMKSSIIDLNGRESVTDLEGFSIHTDKLYHRFEYFAIIDDDLKEINLPGETLTIRCDFTFIKYRNQLELPNSGHGSAAEVIIDDYQECGGSITSTPMEPNFEYFGELFNSHQFSDVKIHVNGKEYPAHKSILAVRSPVFAALLKHEMIENQTNRIDINDIEDEVFVEALRFIYTGKVQNIETLAFELLPVADRYDLQKLKIICANALCKSLSVETAVKILLLAYMYNETNLKKQAIDYIRAYSVDIVRNTDSVAWVNLMSQPDLSKEIFLSCLN